MNQKNLNKNITCTHMEDAPEITMQQDRDKFLSYRFEVMDDENIYSILFKGKLTEKDAKKMLEMIQNCLYEKMADCIQVYLDKNNIAYSGFVSTKKPLGHNKVMELAELLLHSDRCSGFDSYLGNTDTYYLIADHQKLIAENCCQGCNFVVKRTLSESESLYKYNIIGQIFSCNQDTGDEAGYFAIRKNKDDGLMDNVALSSGETVLPSFGCIDLTALLLNIDSIQTAQQVIEIAVK
ncbi:MAG: hypothetical protein K2J67_04695 [Lachnospiraceae bacterium]|nr:hypothetical protein [Lachnospiraceae bacterium]